MTLDMTLDVYQTGVIDALRGINLTSVDRATHALLHAERIYTFGNGGSGATASHIAGDLAKGCKLQAFCLNDNTPQVSAISNDVKYRSVFVNQVRLYLNREDAVIAISGSGNSRNILYATGLARSKGAVTIGLSGYGGGKLAEEVDIPIVVLCYDMEQVEDIHLVVCHMMKKRVLELQQEAEDA